MPEPGAGGAFPHLNLVYRNQRPARFQGPRFDHERANQNKAEREHHSGHLRGQFDSLRENTQASRREREERGLPPIRTGVPFVVEVSDSVDLDDLSRKLKFEVVSEEVVGENEDTRRYVLVAVEDIDSPEVLRMIGEFSSGAHGSAIVAEMFEVVSDPQDPRRIESILSQELFERWPFGAEEILTLDISFQTRGVLADLGEKPRKGREEPKEAHQARLGSWLEGEIRRVHREWDEFTMTLEDEVRSIIRSYDGEICTIRQDQDVDVTTEIVSYPDSITMRVAMRGEGFNDLVRNHPRIFEVVPPDVIETPFQTATHDEEEWPEFEGLPPEDAAPWVAVIDSGIQEVHRYLSHAIQAGSSLCLVPGKSEDDVADEVRGGGHGTRVAGAVLYPRDEVPSGQHQASCWLANFRVLDEHCGLSKRLFPPRMLERAVEHLSDGRVFVHSINADAPCRLRHMSAWAAKMDDLSHRKNVLFVVSAGNLRDRQHPPGKGILDHLASSTAYPAYLLEDSARIAQPAQSLQALTVGSVAKADFEEEDWRCMAGQDRTSPFSRSGPGIWDIPKPDVVEFGGDLCRTTEEPPPTLAVKEETSPLLIRSTLQGGPSMARDDVGTSYAAPKVAALAAEILRTLPGVSPLQARALIANAARWPEWAEQEEDQEVRGTLFRYIGYGIPSWERALENASHRVTMITSDACELRAGEAAVFEVPIPEELNAPGQENRFRIDVTLSYSSEPRRTRASLRGYQSVWLDWRSSSFGQPLEDFLAKMWKDVDVENAQSGRSIPWMLGMQDQHGRARGLRRCGSLQKDWAECVGYDLPDTFAIAVRGHKGWNQSDPNATARYTVAVTLESLNPDIEVYTHIKNAIETRVRTETQRVTV